MNKIMVFGRVSTDVTTNEVNGRQVANFNVASQNKNKTGTENGKNVYGVNFYRVSAWGQSADTAAKFLRKGHRVCVCGDFVSREYTGSDGQKHTSLEITNAEIDLVETRAESEAKLNAAAGVAGTYNAKPAAAQPAQSFTPVETDELPF